MKKKDFIDLRAKDLKDLVKLVAEKRKVAMAARMGIAGGKEKNLKLYRNIRLEIAKILSLVKEKQIIEKLKVVEVSSEKKLPKETK